jgi:hypothetical protein
VQGNESANMPLTVLFLNDLCSFRGVRVCTCTYGCDPLHQNCMVFHVYGMPLGQVVRGSGTVVVGKTYTS